MLCDNEMKEMSLGDWNEKSWKKNDQDDVDGMKQEVNSEGKVMHVEMSDLWFLKRKMKVVERWWQQMKSEFSKATEQISNYGDSQIEGFIM